MEELAVLRLLKANPKATQEQLAGQIHRSPRTVKTLTARLTQKGYLVRRNGKRDGWWEVLTEIPETLRGLSVGREEQRGLFLGWDEIERNLEQWARNDNCWFDNADL